MRPIKSKSRKNHAWLVLGVLALAAVWALPAAADHTRFWRQSDYEQFENGTAKGVALRSDGGIFLAPKFAQVADPGLAYLWALRADSHGNLYAAGGSNAKVIRMDASGKATTVFESSEMTAQTLTLDKSDNLYVGTSPDGKVYKVTPGGTKTVFFDPKTKYIWDLALAPSGVLYVATGDTGKIFAVAPDGKGQLFYSSGETHIRALALDGKGNLIAGTEPNGRVVRIGLGTDAATTDAGVHSGFVLYETARREVTALTADDAGNLYVAAIGEKQRSNGPVTPPPAQPQPAPAAGQGITITLGASAGEQAAPATGAAFAPIVFPSTTSSSVYRIAADGAPEEIWSSTEEVVYSLVLTADGKPLLGVGNQGAVIRLEGDRVYSRLAKAESKQVTGFARTVNGKIFVAMANPGKIFSLGPDLATEGTFESEPFDAHIFSRWGRLSWWGGDSGNAKDPTQFYVRTGNTSDPSNSWSPWAGPYTRASEVQTPAARFVQWKGVLHSGDGATPGVSWVELAYLSKNVAPRITAIALQKPGIRLMSFGGGQGIGNSAPVQLKMPSASGSQNGSSSAQRAQAENARFEVPPQGVVQKGFQSVLWSSADENDDDLSYAVYYRGEAEKEWKLLKNKLDQKNYTWDTASMPDGAYYLKIVASDAPSNPPGDELEGSRESERFVVDNTPPQVSEISAQASGAGNDRIETVRFRATDGTSPLVQAQYSVDAADWIAVRPAGGLSDSLDELYVLSLPNLAPGEHTVGVRVYDQFENQAAGKVTFTVPATDSKRK